MLLRRRLRGGFPWTAASAAAALAALTLLFTLSAGPAVAQAGSDHPGQSALAARSRHGWVKYYIVQPPRNGHKEFLFEIAAKTLGNGDRAAQIFRLNKGRLQPGGGRMEKETIILPGWILVLPANAQGIGVRYGPLPGVTASPSAAPSGRASSAVSAAPRGSPATARTRGASSSSRSHRERAAAIAGGFLLLGMLLSSALLIMRRRRGKPRAASPDGSASPPGPVSSAKAPSGVPPGAAEATSPYLIPAAGGVLHQAPAPGGTAALSEAELSYSQAALNGHTVVQGQAAFHERSGPDRPGGPGYPAWLDAPSPLPSLSPPPPPPLGPPALGPPALGPPALGRLAPGPPAPGCSASGELTPAGQPPWRDDAASLTRPADHEQASRFPGWADARDRGAEATSPAPEVPHAPNLPDTPDVADSSGATGAIDATGELPWPDFLAADGPDRADSAAAPVARTEVIRRPGAEPDLAASMTSELKETSRNGRVPENRGQADELPGDSADGAEPAVFSPVALRILGAQRSSPHRAETADVPIQRHVVASGGDWIQVVLTEAPAVRNDDKPRTGRTWLASTPYLLWTPLPYDAPDNGVAFACLGTGDRGCLFIDLAAAPGAVAITGDADSAARLAESIAHQLCMASSAGQPCIVVTVGAALPEPPPPGAAWVPSLSDLGSSVPPPGPADGTELVFCQLQSNDDAFALARYVSSARRRIVPVVLADLPGAPWTFTAQPSHGPSGVRHW